MLGIDVLEESGYKAIAGKRVGLLTHPAGLNRRGESSIDVLRRARNCTTGRPLRSRARHLRQRESQRPSRRQDRPAYRITQSNSLYGQYRKPTSKMLAGLDALVVDLQDVGVRSYTYVSCMRYAMEACFENSVEVIVLDRPNPLGGLKVDGPPVGPPMAQLRRRLPCSVCPWTHHR